MMDSILKCVSTALSIINIDQFDFQVPTIERLEIVHYITHYVAVTVTAPPPPTSIYTTPSTMSASTGAATATNLASPAFDVPVLDTRSPMSAISLLYAIGEWGSTPITMPSFRFLATLFFLLLIGAWVYCASYFARYNRDYCRYVRARMGVTYFFAAMRQRIRTACQWIVRISCACAAWAMAQCTVWLPLACVRMRVFCTRALATGSQCIYHWTVNTAIPIIARINNAVAIPTLRFLWHHTLCLLRWLARKVHLQEGINNIHLYWLYLTRPNDPVIELAWDAAEASLPERMRIMQQNDALHEEIAALRNQHMRESAEMQRNHARQLEDQIRALQPQHARRGSLSVKLVRAPGNVGTSFYGRYY